MDKQEFIETINIGNILSKAHELTVTTKHDVFIDYAGHVNKLTVRICHNGWKHNDDLYMKWLDYKEESKRKHKRYESFETYTAEYYSEEYEINLGNKTKYTVSLLNDLVKCLDNLLDERNV